MDPFREGSELERRFSLLPRGLQGHCRRVSQLCETLALRYGAAPDKARFSGLVHDLARALPPEELLALAKSYGIPVGEMEQSVPLLLHGPVGAELLRREGGVSDEEVLEAVRCHTTGKAGMSLLDKVLFLGDKIEPDKARYYGGLEEVCSWAERDLDQALRAFFHWQIGYLKGKGIPLHPALLEAQQALADTV